MNDNSPIVVGVALDAVTNDVAEVATELGRRLRAPLVPVHAVLPRGARELDETAIAELRDRILAYFAPAIDEGVTVIEPVIERHEPAELVLRTAARAGAQLIIVGGGEPQTV